MSLIDEFLAGNKAFGSKFTEGFVPVPLAKQVAVVACMDARLTVLGLAGSDAHIIRNAGGIVTDDVIRSLTISQRLLGTREVMLIQHTDCGMLTFSDTDFKRQIFDETGMMPPFAMGAFSDIDANVRQSVEQLKASPYLLHRDQVRGFVYDVESGRLTEVT